MNYFVGHLIGGEAGEWHREMAKAISEKFGTWELHEKIAPHVTIFYPFTDNLESAREVIKEHTEHNQVPGNFSITDYDHFDDRVVFAKVSEDGEVRGVVERLREQLSQIPGMPPMDFPVWHPHATLANKLEPEKINEIWQYVQTLPKPNFTFPFDNITIFRKEEPKWLVHESFWFKSEILAD